MYSVEAIYDGTNFKLKEPLTLKGQHEVIITFIDPDIDSKHEEYDDPIYILKPDPSKTPVLGRLDGTMEIPDDFDEPLEEMKEYMY